MPVNDYFDPRNQKAAELVFPFGDASVFTVPYAANIALELFNTKSYVTVEQLTGVSDISVDFSQEPNKSLYVGSELSITLTADATNRDVTFAAGFQTDQTVAPGGVITVTANKTVKTFFEYDGTAFVLKSVISID